MYERPNFSTRDLAALACTTRAAFQLVASRLLLPPFAESPGGEHNGYGSAAAKRLAERQRNVAWALRAGLDEGLLPLSLSNLLYTENTCSYKKCR